MYLLNVQYTNVLLSFLIYIHISKPVRQKVFNYWYKLSMLKLLNNIFYFIKKKFLFFYITLFY